ncbi:MAG: hypothetical protein M1816_004114 [Peltula sp. TS41687]|nr:MAG: hypothetical protein M1816_004114 [Peltula sp. TS41687]
MSSKFVSAGLEADSGQNTDEWERAQKDIEEARRRKEKEGRQDGGKSLYEVLQQNKVAKQEAFEESIKLKNQFRSLDDDEVEFLDSVLESTRAKEAAVKKETIEQLDIFRRQQEEADKALLLRDDDVTGQNVGNAALEEEQWKITAKKRKRSGEKETLKGVKLRKSSTSEKPTASTPMTNPQSSIPTAEAKTSASMAGSLSRSPSNKAAVVKPITERPTSESTKADNHGPSSKGTPSGGLLGLDYGSDNESS